ncbi:AfsR/SARP family transcriptional regulator [Saccharothrix variisporea]|uniref:DNA-binding SARP family transcriptional activator n=1 Tax=Saccharothrix variisporea TaxID=543527 RepID=A0A495X5G4_9PSEU|nr:BTAD domain-containing putative transcriptional regulator [Saccharothrix variisporea]RKT69202.1 DNA-binding SARP family transcriptional activator [Saccharothrix variisporea]
MRFRVLGSVEAYDGDRRLPVPGGKPLLLLAALLTEAGRVVAVDRLVDILWPEDPPETCRALIHTHVATLRRALKAGDEITTRPPGYLLRVGTDDLDSAVFERDVGDAREAAAGGRATDAIRTYRAAEALWRGSVAYAGVEAAPVVAEANRLDALRLAAIEERIDIELGLGRERELVSELTGVVAARPHNERLRARLMVVLYRLGRQADALATYAAGRAALVDTLGIEPGPELRGTHEAILRGDPVLLPTTPDARTTPDTSTTADKTTGDTPTAPGTPTTADAPTTAEQVPSPPEAPPTTRAQTGTPARRAPAQLPIVPADFTGRATAIAEMVAMLTSDAAPTCVVAGQGGAGKSTLALRVAHDLAPSFPDGQLYVDLRGASGSPTPPVEVLGRFLRALGSDPAAVPDSLDERADHFRTLLSTRRMLVVLDDAAGEGQVRPLLPGGAGNAVIVTARRRLPGLAGATHVQLDVMSEDEAVALLGRIAGPQRVAAEPDQARELVRLCGFLPLPVRIVGARLASRSYWTLAAMVARLADETRRLDELAVADQQVRAGIEVTYRGLDERSRAALRALCWMSLPDFPAWVTARLLDIPTDDADLAIEALLDAHLMAVVTVDGVGQPRFRIHELIQIYGREQAAAADPPEHRAAAVRRVLGTWLRLVDQAGAHAPGGTIPFAPELPRDEPVDPVDQVTAGPSGTAPAAWLEAEQAALVAAVERAAALGLVDSAVALATALGGSVFALGNQFEAWRRTHTAALAAARDAGDRAAEAVMLAQLGQLYYTQDNYGPAHQHLLEALTTFRELGDPRGEATAQASLGWICREQGRLPEALHFLRQAHAYFTTTSLDPAIGYTGRLIGTTLLEQGEFDQARADLTEALAAYRRCGSRHGEALVLRSLGLVHRAVGELDEALALSTEALAILRAIGDEKHEAYGLQAVAKTLVRLGRGDEAGPMLDQAMAICERLDDAWGVAFVLRTRGELHLAAGRLTEAEDDLTGAIRMFADLDVAMMRARAERDLARVLDARGDHAAAEKVRENALATFKTHGAREFRE